jgi:4'-phosphopantetheinyl transferase
VISLEADEVRVFLAEPDRLGPAADLRSILSSDDLAHVDRFRFERDRELSLASRALQRRALSECARVEPSAWVFQTDASGKPHIAVPDAAAGLRFSVSNTAGLVACAVARSRDVGVDLEAIRQEIPMEVVRRCWTPREAADLAAAPADVRRRRFVETWVAKEAYAKARGLGLALDVLLVDALIDGDRSRLQLDATLNDSAGNWTLSVWWPTPRAAAALCVRHDSRPVRITRRWLGPRRPTASTGAGTPR